jgi:hypothetical protein
MTAELIALGIMAASLVGIAFAVYGLIESRRR